jgi:hypothetical protein
MRQKRMSGALVQEGNKCIAQNEFSFSKSPFGSGDSADIADIC